MSAVRRLRPLALVWIVLLGGTPVGASATAPVAQNEDRVVATTSARGGDRCARPRWVTAWSSAPGHARPGPLASTTVRQIVFPHTDGSRVRLRLTNRFGTAPLQVDAVYVGLSATGGPGILPGSNREATFDGSAVAVIPPGEDLVSDPVTIRVRTFEPLAVSLFHQTLGIVSEHVDAHRFAFSTVGNQASSTSGLTFAKSSITSATLSGIEVDSGRRGFTVAAFGDSITDGYQYLPKQIATFGANHRYPDFLTRRLQRAGRDEIAVANVGISGNQVTRDASGDGLVIGAGPAGVERFRPDVLAMAGIRGVIIMEGTNDVGVDPPQPPHVIIAGLKNLVRQAHRQRVHVLLGTIPPRGDVDAERIERIAAVNRWIRRQTVADGVVEFRSALADPANPNTLNPAYDSGDHLHPNSAGYQAMARAVPLRRLAAMSCPR